MKPSLVPFLLLLLVFDLSGRCRCKIYDRCELARELFERYKVPKHDLSKWLCVIYWASDYDTEALFKNRDGRSAGHGLFQINDRYWCKPRKGYSLNACGVNCDDLRDDDLADDIKCVKMIFWNHGFDGWTPYRTRCADDTSSYFDSCDITSRALSMETHPKGVTLHFKPFNFMRTLRSLLKPSITAVIKIRPGGDSTLHET